MLICASAFSAQPTFLHPCRVQAATRVEHVGVEHVVGRRTLVCHNADFACEPRENEAARPYSLKVPVLPVPVVLES